MSYSPQTGIHAFVALQKGRAAGEEGADSIGLESAMFVQDVASPVSAKYMIIHNC